MVTALETVRKPRAAGLEKGKDKTNILNQNNEHDCEENTPGLEFLKEVITSDIEKSVPANSNYFCSTALKSIHLPER